jgi:Anti-sigma-K factor rskA
VQLDRSLSLPLRALVLGLALAFGLPAAPSAANGTPFNVVLSYLNGVSNWGPANASGVAEIATRDGEVRLSATGLPQLSGEQYVVWIVDTAQNVRQPLAEFNSDGTVARVDEVLPASIPERAWDLVMVTVEAEGGRPTAPSNRHSIAGRIQPPVTSQSQPSELPRTGGAPSVPEGAPGTGTIPYVVFFGALLCLFLGGALGFGLARLAARRPTQ